MDAIRLEDTPRSEGFRQLEDVEELEQIRWAFTFSVALTSDFSSSADIRILPQLVS